MEEQFAKSNLYNGYIIENTYYKSIKNITTPNDDKLNK